MYTDAKFCEVISILKAMVALVKEEISKFYNRNHILVIP